MYVSHLSDPCQFFAEGTEFWSPAWPYKAAKLVDHFQSGGFTGPIDPLVRPSHHANWPFLHSVSFTRANEAKPRANQDFIRPMKPS